MTYDPSKADWDIADQLWKRMEQMNRRKARTIFTSLVTSSPEVIKAAGNILNDPET